MQHHRTPPNIAQNRERQPAHAQALTDEPVSGEGVVGSLADRGRHIIHSGKPRHLTHRLTLLVVLVAAIACLNILPRYGFFLEDLQTVTFPLIVVVLWQMARGTKLAIPPVILFVAVALWLIGALNVRAILPTPFAASGSYLSRLDGDVTEQQDRELYYRYNQISSVYDLPPLRFMQREFTDSDEAFDWLQRHGDDVPFLIGGSADWLRVFLQPKVVSLTGDSTELTESYSGVAKKLHLRVGRDFQPMKVPGADFVVAVSVVPQEFVVPGSPTELSRHFLAWLGQALADPQSLLRHRTLFEGGANGSIPLNELVYQLRLFYLDSAAFVDGLWKSSTPRAMALYLKGNMQLQRALMSPEGLSELECIRDIFNRAAGAIQRKYAPELYASIYNNAAIVEILSFRGDDDLRGTVKLFDRAIGTRDRDGNTPVAARIAMLNRIMLKEEGIL